MLVLGLLASIALATSSWKSSTTPQGLSLVEISTRPWLYELSLKYKREISTLAAIPDNELVSLAACGFEVVWMMGVWQLGSYGLNYDRTDPDLLKFYEKVLPDYSIDDVIGSPYAIVDYVLNKDLGTLDDLSNLRSRVNAHGMRLFLDFVPNHTAVDGMLVSQNMDLFVKAPSKPYDPSWYQPDGVAWGRDPYSGAWLDTSQLNYWNPETVKTQTDIFVSIAKVADGARVDMAMLLLNDVIEKTWGSQMNANGWPRPSAEFWPQAVKAAKAANPSFTIMAEVYWGLGPTLLDMGFDLTYDKDLYDKLSAFDYDGIHEYIAHPPHGYFRGAAHFVANHDQPPACIQFTSCAQADAAAVVTMALPGARFYFQDEQKGPHHQLAVQLRRRATEPARHASEEWYRKLYNITSHPVFRDGSFSALAANNTFMIAVGWELDGGDGEKRVVIVNYSDQQRSGSVVVPNAQAVDGNDQINVTDLWSGKTWKRSAKQMRTSGLECIIPPWTPQIFSY